MKTESAVLTDELFHTLQTQTFVLLAVTDEESGAPSQHAVSWIYAVSPERLRFAVDQRSRIVANLRKHPNMVVTVFAGQSVFAIRGLASVNSDVLPDVPLKLTCMDVEVQSVRDIMYYGSQISAGPVCEKTYDHRAAEKLDQQVFDAMKKA